MDVMKAVESLQSDLWGVWFLIGAALVFWMQAGFAMVEGGFTRAKNAGNIIMKNLMDFCIGTVMFMLIGFSLLLGEDYLGFIGKPGFDLFTNFANFNFSTFVFNLVFCATTATIVSGAMAERTKFLSYCVYSAVISALIYPIEAHWISTLSQILQAEVPEKYYLSQKACLGILRRASARGKELPEVLRLALERQASMDTTAV